MTDHYQRLAKYNLTPAEYKMILKEQGGVCAICLSPPGDRRLCVDHDHRCCDFDGSCGACIRGLLCHVCNRHLGLLESLESSGFIDNAAKYMASYATRRASYA